MIRRTGNLLTIVEGKSNHRGISTSSAHIDQSLNRNRAIGAALSAPSGKWLVYATSPGGNVNGWPVLGGSQQFSTTYPQPALFTGNGFLYKVGLLSPMNGNLFKTEPVTFSFIKLNFNEQEWRDLSDLGEAVLFPEDLLCVNVPVNQTSGLTRLTQPLVLKTANIPIVDIQWQIGEYPRCNIE